MIVDNLWVYIAIGVAALVIGLSKGGLGGTVVAVVTPMLVLVLPPKDAKDAVGMGLPLLLLGDVFAVAMFWKKWDGPMIWRMLPGLIVGVIVGSLLLPVLPSQVVRIGIAVMVLAFCGYKLLEPTIRRRLEQGDSQPNWWNASLFAGTSGVASTVANAGGPIISAYFLMEHLSPISFIGTSALYFALVNVMKIPGLISAQVLRLDILWRVVWATPLVPLGVWLGKVMLHYVL